MKKKLAKIKYLPNNFQIIEPGDYVICAVSNKKISIEDLTYWNVELQEAYYSYKEAFKKEKILNNKFIHYFQRLCDQIHCSGFSIIIFSINRFNSSVICFSEWSLKNL